MSQKTAYYTAYIGQPGRAPDTYIQAIELPTRRELVEWVNDCLDYGMFSQRTRRQVSLPFVWRYIQRYGCSHNASFTLESTVAGFAGIIEFRAMTESEFMRKLKQL